jgi:formate-dependent phosphoribosylglycinamide formyltransferase (GAR transformylase)
VVRPRRWWIGIAAGVALGLGGVVAVEVATEDASAQNGFRVTPGQLKINQKISQAAVRRSNESLQLLDPIRRRQNQPARVLGWRTQDLRDSAITTVKLNDSAITTAKLANGSVTN